LVFWSLLEGGDLAPVSIPKASLALVVVAAPIAFSAIVSVPARLLARRPAAPVLAYE
jgi:hypothetical protein